MNESIAHNRANVGSNAYKPDDRARQNLTSAFYWCSICLPSLNSEVGSYAVTQDGVQKAVCGLLSGLAINGRDKEGVQKAYCYLYERGFCRDKACLVLCIFL